jgi:Bacterial regulatory helix-turn-helix protein, lysR family
MRSLNLDQLRALVEVIEQGSFSAAARRLNLTQPAVSLQVRELERRFGVQLVEQLGRQAHATLPGRELVLAAQRIFCDAAGCKQAIARHAAASATIGGDILCGRATTSRQSHADLCGASAVGHRAHAWRGICVDHALAFRRATTAACANASRHGRSAQDGREIHTRDVDRT